MLNNEARDQFLDFLYKDLAEALRRLIRISDGDYSPDSTDSGFPNLKAATAARRRRSFLSDG